MRDSGERLRPSSGEQRRRYVRQRDHLRPHPDLGRDHTIYDVNRIIGGGNGTIRLQAGVSFVDASHIATRYAFGSNFTAPILTDRMLTLVSLGVNRAHTLHTAVGCPGKSITFVNTHATFTWAITPNGTEKINNVNATKTLGAGYSSVTLTSDGSNWLMTNVVGTVS